MPVAEPDLVLGPMLRFADSSRATVWVRTDAACEVQVDVAVPGAPVTGRSRTFAAHGHHFALVLVEGLPPASSAPYVVRLDGRQVWPQPGSQLPPSLVRTADGARPFTLMFGSCRVGAPVEGEWLERYGADALHEAARRMAQAPPATWPDLLLFVGDQVYADDNVPPATVDFMRSRRDTSEPPWESVADFEEYCALYAETWGDEVVRWLMSTVPTAMVFDDHDIVDDWNTSAAWREQVHRSSWWHDRVSGGLAAYWVHQHMGNLSPDDLARSQLWQQLQRCAADGTDAGPLLDDFGAAADAAVGSSECIPWSYARDLGDSRLVVVDSRCGRVLDGTRRMLDEEERAWVARTCEGVRGHLLIATSLPVFLPPAIGDLESWDEAVAGGAWGRWATGLGERVRQAVDLEHWAAFRASFEEMVQLLADLSSGRRGRAPASITLLSGDVHYAYLARVHLDDAASGACPVWQATCSPLRNAVDRRLATANLLAANPVGTAIGRVLARSAGVPRPRARWGLDVGPFFDNEVATVAMRGQTADFRLERVVPRPDPHGPPGAHELETVAVRRLTPG